jgi:hypothetical protein
MVKILSKYWKVEAMAKYETLQHTDHWMKHYSFGVIADSVEEAILNIR